MKRIKKIIRRKSLRQDSLADEQNILPMESNCDDILWPDKLCGTWESVNLNPSLIIYRDRGKYLLSVIGIASSGQAAPSTYEIECEDGKRFIRLPGRRAELSYEPLLDELHLAGYGSYMRN